MRPALGWVAPLVLVVVAVLVLTWLVRRAEPWLAFFPVSGETVTPDSFGIAFTPLTITTKDGERLRAWHLPREDARAQVVYFHGNGGNLSIWSDVLAGLWQERFEVIALDYRGYGLSTGRPSEQGLYRDTDATLAHLHGGLRRPDVPLIYWGRSLGTTMAAYAASRHPPDGVVLEAGFPSVRSVLETNPVMWALSWVSSYRFPTAAWMAEVRQPTLVLHGDSDRVIPYRLGQRLYATLEGPKTFVTIPGGDHNDPAPRDAEAYWRAVSEFVQSLAT
jgi:uncharacterized protein